MILQWNESNTEKNMQFNWGTIKMFKAFAVWGNKAAAARSRSDWLIIAFQTTSGYSEILSRKPRKKKYLNIWWCQFEIPALERLKQEGREIWGQVKLHSKILFKKQKQKPKPNQSNKPTNQKPLSYRFKKMLTNALFVFEQTFSEEKTRHHFYDHVRTTFMINILRVISFTFK